MQKINILVVNPDQKSIALLLSHLMGDWSSIRLVSNGIEALQKISEDEPDVVVADVDIPGMSGIELCNMIKGSQEFSKISVILLISINDKLKEDECLEAGASRVLSKFTHPDEIVTSIKNVMQEPSTPDTDSSGGLTGDLDQMNLVELIQSMDMNAKTGKLSLMSFGKKGYLFFEKGKVIDASAGKLRGDLAVFRMLSWDNGFFSFQNGVLADERRVLMRSQSLILEGLRQYDEKKRLLNDLPDLAMVCKPKGVLSDLLRQNELDRYEKRILVHFRGSKTLRKILDDNEIGDLETLQAFFSLIKREIVIPVARGEQEDGRIVVSREKQNVKGRDKGIKISQGFFGHIEDVLGQDDHEKN